MDRVSGSKRLRDWVDDGDSGAVTPRSTTTHLYDAVDIAAALHIPLLDDDVMLRVVQPTLRGAVKSCGLVPFNTLANTLANVLTDNSSALCFALHQFQIDSCIFGVGLQHEHADSARIFCSLLSVDPWNTLDETSGCQVGNFNQVPPSLNDAVRFFRGKSWDIKIARNMALSALSQHNVSSIMNFSPQRAQRHRQQRRL